MTAVVILGMHRSGTSCLAGMLVAGGRAAAGDSVRNWDNERGHHEMLDVVRLDEAVLAYSRGHWLAPPTEVRWTDAHARERDRLLRLVIDGRPALLKDPRMLLVLPFWRASQIPFDVVGIVRHPLAVARSLAGWRGMPLVEGLALWTAHNRVLAADHAAHGYPLVDFDAPKELMVETVTSAFALDADAAAAAFDERLVHHAGDIDALDDVTRAALDDALALHRILAHGPRATRGGTNPAASLVPLVTKLVRERAFDGARRAIAGAQVDPVLADLLDGKVLLAMGDAAAAVDRLTAACAVRNPYFQALALLPQALRAAGRPVEARAAMQPVIAAALYPHGPLATLAEWSWLDGARVAALGEMARAIEAAPLHRRGRLRTRRAEWLVAAGDPHAARVELLRAIEEDPAYARSREVLVSTEALLRGS